MIDSCSLLNCEAFKAIPHNGRLFCLDMFFVVEYPEDLLT